MEINHRFGHTSQSMPELQAEMKRVEKIHKEAYVNTERIEYDMVSSERNSMDENKWTWVGTTIHLWIDGVYNQLDRYVHIWIRKDTDITSYKGI